MKIQYYPPKIVKDNLLKLHQNITIPILEHFGGDYILTINSGYRCKEYNDSLFGASKTSDHLTGAAMDIELSKNGKSCNKELFDFIRKNLKFKQVINERNYSWIHVSFDEVNLRGQILNL
jgi:hypothetical protein